MSADRSSSVPPLVVPRSGDLCRGSLDRKGRTARIWTSPRDSPLDLDKTHCLATCRPLDGISVLRSGCASIQTGSIVQQGFVSPTRDRPRGGLRPGEHQRHSPLSRPAIARPGRRGRLRFRTDRLRASASTRAAVSMVRVARSRKRIWTIGVKSDAYSPTCLQRNSRAAASSPVDGAEPSACRPGRWRSVARSSRWIEGSSAKRLLIGFGSESTLERRTAVRER